MKKPECVLVGTDGNVFALIGVVRNALRKAGMGLEAEEMSERVLGCSSYDEALTIIGHYVEIC